MKMRPKVKSSVLPTVRKHGHRSIVGKNIVCPICGSKHTTKNALRNHNYDHHRGTDAE